MLLFGTWLWLKRALLLHSLIGPCQVPLPCWYQRHPLKHNTQWWQGESRDCRSNFSSIWHLCRGYYSWKEQGARSWQWQKNSPKYPIWRCDSSHKKSLPWLDMEMGQDYSEGAHHSDQKRCKLWRRLESHQKIFFIHFFQALPNILAILLLHVNNLRRNYAKWWTFLYKRQAQVVNWWLLVVTCWGQFKAKIWDSTPFNIFTKSIPFLFSHIMSRKWFNNVTFKLQLTRKAGPPYFIYYWELSEMVNVWNKNMAILFFPSWMVYLDESMSIWYQQWTCCEWVFCNQNPIFLAMNTTLIGRGKWLFSSTWNSQVKLLTLADMLSFTMAFVFEGHHCTEEERCLCCFLHQKALVLALFCSRRSNPWIL